METKPFHLQAPEQIAKDYDGNKQKIAQASHLGLLDPTAALLAGMFIDRMRSAAMKEQGPPQTVAQQVFAPTAPPAPAPMGGPGGPPPMPPMGGPPPAPGPGGPPPPQMNAPQGMAEGGLASLPVPDSMYDEPVDAQSFGGGGIGAFATGKEVETAPFSTAPTDHTDWSLTGTLGRWGQDIAAAASNVDKAAAARRNTLASQDVVYQNGNYYDKTGFGTRPLAGTKVLDTASGKYFVVPENDTRAVHTTARTTAPDAATAASIKNDITAHLAKNADTATAAPAAPATATAAAPAARRPKTGLTAIAPPGTSGMDLTSIRNLGGPVPPTPEPTDAGPTEQQDIDKFTQMMGGDKANKYRDLQAAEYEKDHTPEALAAQKKYDLYKTIGQFGAALGASKSPNLLTAFNEAAGVALPDMAKTKADRIAQEHDAIKELATNESATRAERIQMVSGALALRQAGIKNKQDEKTYNLAVQVAADNLKIEEGKLEAKVEENKNTKAYQDTVGKADLMKAGADVANAGRDRSAMTENQRMVANEKALASVQKMKLKFTDPKTGKEREAEGQFAPLADQIAAAQKIVPFYMGTSGGSGGATGGKTVNRTGVLNGRKIIEYTDGTSTYAN